jgi:WD40 repeat protein
MPEPEEPAHEPVTRLTGLDGAIHAVAFSRDGGLLAAGDASGTVQVWRGHTPVTSMRGHGGISSLAFSPGADTLVTTDSSAKATLWNVKPRGAPDRLAALTLPGGPGRAIDFRPDGRALLAAGSDGTAKSWNVTDPTRPGQRADLVIHAGAVRTVAFSPDNRTVAAVGAGNGQLTGEGLLRYGHSLRTEQRLRVGPGQRAEPVGEPGQHSGVLHGV